jgi:hypothetical protein
MGSNGPLVKLHDIHLPKVVSIFPLAYGWYIIGLIVLTVLLILSLIYYKKMVRTIKNKAQLEYMFSILDEIMADNNKNMLADLSVLLKRVARNKYATQKPQLLFGKEWLLFLDNTGKTQEFSTGIGNVLANSYQPIELSLDKKNQLTILIKKWLIFVINSK